MPDMGPYGLLRHNRKRDHVKQNKSDALQGYVTKGVPGLEQQMLAGKDVQHRGKLHRSLSGLI